VSSFAHDYPVRSVCRLSDAFGVARPDFPRSIVEFQGRFADDDACRVYLFASRWPDGYVCRRCGGSEVGLLQRRGVWQCRGCGQQTSITAGTVMHGTRTPLTLWFWAAYLVATHTPGISALQLQRQLGIGRYETAWLLLHKLRRAMVAPERQALKGEVEIDEAFVGGRDSRRRGGRQRDGKALVGVAVEVRGAGSGRLRLQILPDAGRATLGPWVSSLVEPGAIVHTDGWDGYGTLTSLGFDHRARVQRARHPDRQFVLARAHRAVSNLKTWLQGTHRGVSPEHLQVYLDEFVFRHNRRRTPLAAFQTLLGLGASRPPTTYRQITQTEPTG
jgi:transposase-like protein/ribosomal protein L37AE/L43A